MRGIERRQRWVYFMVSFPLYHGLGKRDSAPWFRLNRPRPAAAGRQRSMVGHHAHCRMSFIFHADCTIVSAYRSASKVVALEKLYGNSNGTRSACIATPKDRKHRSTNSHRPPDPSSLQFFAPRGRLDPTTRIVVSYRPNECSDNKSKG